MLGVSRQRVQQLAESYDDFPEPAARLVMGSIWHKQDIEAWLERHPRRPAGVHAGTGQRNDRTNSGKEARERG